MLVTQLVCCSGGQWAAAHSGLRVQEDDFPALCPRVGKTPHQPPESISTGEGQLPKADWGPMTRNWGLLDSKTMISATSLVSGIGGIRKGTNATFWARKKGTGIEGERSVRQGLRTQGNAEK